MAKKDGACLACLARDGERYRLEDELSDHPRGRCFLIADIEGMAPATWQTGQEWFNTLEPAKQEMLMGTIRYEAWKSGQINFGDLSRLAHSDIWGNSPRLATIEELGLK